MSRKSTLAIVVHCTATLAHQDFRVPEIRAMHKKRGWKDIGYHWLICLDGTIQQGRKPESSVGSHVQGFNNNTLGIVYVGGLDSKTGKPADTRTAAQKKAMLALLKDLLKRYPKAVILGHRDLSPDKNGNGIIERFEYLKECPCFDAGPWAVSQGLPGGRYRNGKFELLPKSAATMPPPAPLPEPAKPPEPLPDTPDDEIAPPVTTDMTGRTTAAGGAGVLLLGLLSYQQAHWFWLVAAAVLLAAGLILLNRKGD